MDTISSALASADRTWRTYGIGATDRAALLDELHADLQHAATDGLTPDQLLGPDVAEFARRLADEAGLTRVRTHDARLIGTTLGGAAIGAVIGWALHATGHSLLTHYLLQKPDLPLAIRVVLYWSLPALSVAAAAVIAVRYTMRAYPRMRETSTAMIILLPIAGLLVTPLTMAFARWADYSTNLPVVLVEILMVAAALSGATVLARRWALRHHTRPSAIAASPVPVSS